MYDIDERIETAKNNNIELEKLVTDYLPFIKKQISGMTNLGLDYDDCLSLAMMTFINCIEQYNKDVGNFFSFFSVCIKNRIIDERRKENRYHTKVVPLFNNDSENNVNSMDIEASFVEYNKELERQNLSFEIDNLSKELEKFNIKFSELSKICPKQNKSREQCIKIANEIINNNHMKNKLFNFNKISQIELSSIFNISLKTLEKHRKYIVTISILLAGDYPNIRTFIPQYKEVR